MPIRLVSPPPAAPHHEPRNPSTAASYEVGYKRPPAATRFKPGQSGNPRGRPKRSKGFKTIIRESMLERVLVRTPKGERSLTKAEALVLKVFELASKGNLKAMERLLAWYERAMPETADPGPDHASGEVFTAADEAILDAFRSTILGVGPSGTPPGDEE